MWSSNTLKTGGIENPKRVEKLNFLQMRKSYLTILAIVCGMSYGFAQNLDVRLYGGMNVLQLTSDQGTSLIDGTLHHKTVSGRPGYQFGAAITFGERFYVQPGIQFTTISTKVVNQDNVTGTELTDETKVKLFSVPLRFGVRLIDPEVEDVFNIRLFAGIEGHHVVGVDHTTKSGKIDDIDKDDFSNLIINGDFGMGIDFFFLFVEAGYQLGLSPVYSGGDLAKANSFYGNLGLRIKL